MKDGVRLSIFIQRNWVALCIINSNERTSDRMLE